MTHPQEPWVVRAQGVHKRYSGGPQTVQVLAGIDLQLQRGHSLAITGSSGSGKSTLLHLLGGLDEADAGSIEVCGRTWRSMSAAQQGQWRNLQVGFVYQFHHLLPEFTALDNVMMPLRIRRLAATQAQQQAAALLEQVGLGPRLGHRPAELSGGERQRVALARALVTRPALLLADEPTGNLDSDSAEQVFSLLEQMVQRHGTAMVLVTHDRQLAARCSRVLELHHGSLREAERAA